MAVSQCDSIFCKLAIPESHSGLTPTPTDDSSKAQHYVAVQVLLRFIINKVKNQHKKTHKLTV